MTEDQIGPLCARLRDAIKAEKTDEAVTLVFELLAGFLTDINRLAWFAEQQYALEERDRKS
jgi:hypothetical protein